ncbi:MAG: hypothetical protein ACK51K_14680, partial [Gammaproteobacteria bacterium]
MSGSDDLVRPERRGFLTTAGGALALGGAGLASMSFGPTASAAAASSLLTSKYGVGPGLKGPYLDLTTGKGNQLAYARIQGDL